MLKVKRTLHKIGLSHPSQRLLPCCITGKTALPPWLGFALDYTFPTGWGHRMPRKGVLGPSAPPGPPEFD